MMYAVETEPVEDPSRNEELKLWLSLQLVVVYRSYEQRLTPEPPGLKPEDMAQFLHWAERHKYIVPMCGDKGSGVLVYQVTVGEDVTELLAADVVYYCHHVPGYAQALQWLTNLGVHEEVLAEKECPLTWHEPWPGMTPWTSGRAARAFVQELAELGFLTRISTCRQGTKVQVRFRVNRELCALALSTLKAQTFNIERLIVMLLAFKDNGTVALRQGGVVILEAHVPQITQRPRGRPRKPR